MKRFANRTVVVTGGGGGIGGATCRRFAGEGAKVAVFDLNLNAAKKVAGEIVTGENSLRPSSATSPIARASMRRSRGRKPSLGRSTCW